MLVRGVPVMVGGRFAGGVTGAAIACPTLVIPGSDMIHPTEAGVAVAAMITGAACATPFDGLPRDREVAEMVELVRSFCVAEGVLG